jgi:hypothetical protein
MLAHRRALLPLLLAVALGAAESLRAEAPASPSPGTAAGAPAAGCDLLGEALARLGLERADLGYRPQGSWTRFPLLETVPHLNPAFADLFARPQVIPRYLHGLADPVRKYLDSARLADKDDGLYQLTYFLAVERFAPGFRNYSANAVVAPPDAAAPLADALARLGREVGVGERPQSFGGQYAAVAGPDSAALAGLDPALARVTADGAQAGRRRAGVAPPSAAPIAVFRMKFALRIARARPTYPPPTISPCCGIGSPWPMAPSRRPRPSTRRAWRWPRCRPRRARAAGSCWTPPRRWAAS